MIPNYTFFVFFLRKISSIKKGSIKRNDIFCFLYFRFRHPNGYSTGYVHFGGVCGFRCSFSFLPRPINPFSVNLPSSPHSFPFLTPASRFPKAWFPRQAEQHQPTLSTVQEASHLHHRIVSPFPVKAADSISFLFFFQEADS